MKAVHTARGNVLIVRMVIRHQRSYHQSMTSIEFEYEVDRALRRRGDPMTTHEFLAVLEEVTSIAVEPLTAGEHAFLMKIPI